jgi:hypothetical protein
VLDLETPQHLATHLLGRIVDIEDEDYDLLPEALGYLARYPLNEERLAQVRSISFGGGQKIYRFAWYFWGGGDDMFDVTDLGGIELCPNVKSVSATSMIDGLDIRQLTPLKSLGHLSTSTGFKSLEALRDLKSLKRLRLLDDRSYKEVTTLAHPTRALFESLKADGVAVWLIPKSWSAQRPPPFE